MFRGADATGIKTDNGNRSCEGSLLAEIAGVLSLYARVWLCDLETSPFSGGWVPFSGD